MLIQEQGESHSIRRAAASGDGRAALLIIGNGMVGHKLCARLAAAGASNRYRIVVLGEERQPAYDRVHLTDFLGGRSPQELTLAPREWYEQNGIELHTGCRAIAVDREARAVFTEDGRAFPYDRLVFATGSRAHVPPMEGADLPGVHVYRTVEDLAAIREQARHARRAAVIGGGLLGLEAARALQALGVECDIIEYGPHVLCAQLDARAGEIAAAQLEKLGMRVRVNTHVERISAEGDVRVLHFAGNAEQPFAVDLVVIATGIRPRHELAHACGLRSAPAGGIVVDDRLQTSDPAIYAIGECAAHRGVSYGLVAPGYRMAEVLADGLMGAPSEFQGADLSTRLKVLGLDVTVVGDYKQPGTVMTWERDGVYRRIVLHGDRFAGAIALGDWPELRQMQDAAARRRRVWAWQASRFRNKGRIWRAAVTPASAWPDHATVCNCMNLSCAALKQACAGGCTTVESLAAATGASTLCGSCRPLLAELLGAGPAAAAPKGARGLVVAAGAALLLIAALLFAPAIPYPATVQTFPYDIIWRSPTWKQATGFAILGASLAGMALSLRKRWRVFNRGDFGFWRMAHGIVGVAGLLLLMAHTGLRFGSNLNFVLMAVFVAANLAGAFAGGMTGVSGQISTAAGLRARRWLTWAHIVLVWPLPVLAAFHVLSVYYF